MFLNIWPFYTPPPPEPEPFFSGLPAWATVGLDMTREEFGSMLSKAFEGKNAIYNLVDFMYPYCPYLLVTVLAAVVLSLYKTYKKKLGWRSELKYEMLNTSASLADRIKKGLALKETIITGLEDVEKRLHMLQQKLQMVQEERRKSGQCRRLKTMHNGSLPSCCSSVDSLSDE